MNGFRREQTEIRDLIVNQGIVENSVDEMLYRPRRQATDLYLLAGPILGNVGPASCVVYPKAAGSAQSGRGDFMLPSGLWLSGNVSVDLVWSGTVASAITNVQWIISVSVSAIGAVPANIGSYSYAAPGPGTINALMRTSFPNHAGNAPVPWPITGASVLVGINIGRQAALGTDTYLGDVNLFSYQLIYTPAKGH